MFCVCVCVHALFGCAVCGVCLKCVSVRVCFCVCLFACVVCVYVRSSCCACVLRSLFLYRVPCCGDCYSLPVPLLWCMCVQLFIGVFLSVCCYSFGILIMFFPSFFSLLCLVVGLLSFVAIRCCCALFFLCLIQDPCRFSGAMVSSLDIRPPRRLRVTALPALCGPVVGLLWFY